MQHRRNVVQLVAGTFVGAVFLLELGRNEVLQLVVVLRDGLFDRFLVLALKAFALGERSDVFWEANRVPRDGAGDGRVDDLNLGLVLERGKKGKVISKLLI